MELLFEEVKCAALEKRAIDTERLTPEKEAIRDRYFETPLSAMERDVRPYAEAVTRAADLIETLDLRT